MNLEDHADGLGFLIRDRDTKFTGGVRRGSRRGRRADHQGPDQGAACERDRGTLGGSARRECLDRMLIAGERHLRLVLGEYAGHYDGHRPHRTLHQNPPAGRAYPAVEMTGMRVLRRDRPGGLIHEYSQVA